MIVECPQCGSKYRIDEDRVPASGGRISCSNCDHAFVLRTRQTASESSDVEAEGNRDRLRDMADEMSEVEVGSDDIGEEDPTEIITDGPAGEMFAGDGAEEIDDGATEIVSDGGAPGFLEERDDEEAEDDGTIEMRNPFLEAHEEPDEGEATLEFEEDGEEDATTKVDRDDLGEMFADDLLEEPRGRDGVEDREGPALHSYEGQRRDTADPTPSSDDPGEADGAVRADDLDRDEAGPQAGTADRRSDRTPGRDRRDSGSVGRSPGRGEGPTQPSESPARGGGRARTPDGSVGSGPGQPGEAGGSPGAGSGPSPWKVKARHGLTYDFSDTEALREWLRERENVRNLRISADGSNFFEPAAFPELEEVIDAGASAPQHAGAGSGPASRGAEPSAPSHRASARQQPGRPSGKAAGSAGGTGAGAGASPGNPPPLPTDSGGSASANRGGTAGQDGLQAAPGGTAEQESGGADWSQALEAAAPEPEAPARSVRRRLLYPILVALIIVAVGVFLDISGSYPVGRMVPGVPSTFEPEAAEGNGATSREESPEGDRPDEAAIGNSEESGEPKDRVDRLLSSARKAVEQERWQTAIETLKAAKLLAPKRPAPHALLAEVYDELGEAKRAERHRKKAEELEAESDSSPSETRASE